MLRPTGSTMSKLLCGTLDADGLRIGIIASQFNEFITGRLLQGAEDALRIHGVKEQDTILVQVPGAMEIPQIAQTMAASGRWDALIAIGSVIRGETLHFDIISSESARGIADVARLTGVPISFAVLTTETIEQAIARSGGQMGNRGFDAGETAIKMATLSRELSYLPES
jgi:6,7-dimethyl-8-ribityllumazine synthase